MQFHRQFAEIQSDGVQTLPVIFSHNLMRREASSFWLKPCLEFEFLFGDFFQELLDSSVLENCLCIPILLLGSGQDLYFIAFQVDELQGGKVGSKIVKANMQNKCTSCYLNGMNSNEILKTVLLKNMFAYCDVECALQIPSTAMQNFWHVLWRQKHHLFDLVFIIQFKD